MVVTDLDSAAMACSVAASGARAIRRCGPPQILPRQGDPAASDGGLLLSAGTELRVDCGCGPAIGRGSGLGGCPRPAPGGGITQGCDFGKPVVAAASELVEEGVQVGVVDGALEGAFTHRSARGTTRWTTSGSVGACAPRGHGRQNYRAVL